MNDHLHEMTDAQLRDEHRVEDFKAACESPSERMSDPERRRKIRDDLGRLRMPLKGDPSPNMLHREVRAELERLWLLEDRYIKHGPPERFEAALRVVAEVVTLRADKSCERLREQGDDACWPCEFLSLCNEAATAIEAGGEK